MLVPEESVEEIRRIGILRAPAEAGGLIAPDGAVLEIPNESDSPEDECLLPAAALLDAVHEWLKRQPDPPDPASLNPRDFAAWHTHPKGNVGPSRMDLQQRRSNPNAMTHLVVPVPTGPATQY